MIDNSQQPKPFKGQPTAKTRQQPSANSQIDQRSIQQPTINNQQPPANSQQPTASTY